MSSKKLCLFVILALLVSSVNTVYATIASDRIEPGKEIAYKIPVEAGDRVEFSFVSTGNAPGMLDFSVVYPNSTIKDWEQTGQYSTGFTAETAGTCELHFKNNDQSEVTLVTLNYNVEHLILGMPQMMFVLVAITVLLLAVVAGYIIMGKYS